MDAGQQEEASLRIGASKAQSDYLLAPESKNCALKKVETCKKDRKANLKGFPLVKRTICKTK